MEWDGTEKHVLGTSLPNPTLMQGQKVKELMNVAQIELETSQKRALTTILLSVSHLPPVNEEKPYIVIIRTNFVKMRPGRQYCITKAETKAKKLLLCRIVALIVGMH